MAGVDYTEENLATIKQAIASGQMQVRYGDTTVSYRSLNEMIQIRDEIARELSGGQEATVSYAGFSRG